MENQEFGIAFIQEPLDELEPECKSVTECDHKDLDSSLHDDVQKGIHTRPLEVDPGANVSEGEELFPWELALCGLEELWREGGSFVVGRRMRHRTDIYVLGQQWGYWRRGLSCRKL
jgi:hypothetical protein